MKGMGGSAGDGLPRRPTHGPRRDVDPGRCHMRAMHRPRAGGYPTEEAARAARPDTSGGEEEGSLTREAAAGEREEQQQERDGEQEP